MACSPPAGQTGIRVGLITPGSVADAAWNSGAYAGLQAIRDSLGLAVSHVEARTPAEQDEALRTYAVQGYDLVFAHGFEFQGAAERVSAQYPKTVFIVTSGSRAQGNVAPLIFKLEDASYLAGMVAGGLTRSNILGFVGGIELPPIKAAYEGWVNGAKAVNPRVQSREIYLNSFDDAAAGREAALALIRVGADMFHHNADAAALGVFQAAKESPGVYVFGANADQSSLAPGRVLGSAVIDLPRAFLLVAREVKAGTFRPKVESFGLQSGVVRYEANPALDSLVPAALKARVKAAADSIAAGNTGARAPAGIDAGARLRSAVRLATRHTRSRGMAGADDVSPVPLAEIVRYLDEYLRIREVPDERNAVNGLQVENLGLVGGIVAAVDASQATIDGVIAEGPGRGDAAPLLLVHHGLFWDGNVPLTGRRYRRVSALLEHDIPLYSAHIPLDLHPTVGNNVVLAERLGLEVEGWFGDYKGVPIGVWGRVPARLAPRDALLAEVNHALGTPSPGARLIAGGPERVTRVGVITGGAGNMIGAAHDAGLDTFITGEGAHYTYFDAVEWGLNVVFAGHYATETLGVQALASHLAERFELEWEFHDHPTGL